RLGQRLGGPRPVDAPVAGRHRRSHAEGSGPRPPAHLVDAHHHLTALGPQRPLDGEAGNDAAGGQRRTGPAGRDRRHRQKDSQAPASRPGTAPPYASSTAGSPARTSPTRKNAPPPVSASASGGETAARRPPEVWGS